MDLSILIIWMSPFRISEVSGVLFHFYFIFDRNSCQQTVKTLIRRRVLRRLILVYTVCLCPKKWDAMLIRVKLGYFLNSGEPNRCRFVLYIFTVSDRFLRRNEKVKVGLMYYKTLLLTELRQTNL